MTFADSSAADFSNSLTKDDTLFVAYQSKFNEDIFLSRILTNLNSKGVGIVFDKQKAGKFLNYYLDDAGVTYPEAIKAGFFDDYLVLRKIYYKGKFSFSDKIGIIKSADFNFEKADTVNYSDIQTVDNRNFNFTTAELPNEPFWASLTEPIIAIGTIIVTVVLLFTVRSK